MAQAVGSATEWLGAYGEARDVRILVDLFSKAEKVDPIVAAKLKIATRGLLRSDSIRSSLFDEWTNTASKPNLDKQHELIGVETSQADLLLPIVLALRSDQIPGDALLVYLEKRASNAYILDQWLPRIATLVSEKQLPSLLQLLERSYKDSSSKTLEIVETIVQQQKSKSASVSESLRLFAERIALLEVNRISDVWIRPLKTKVQFDGKN